ncbi:MAG: hypothetical protein AAGA30_21685 [Planctomycetota bacterium]
MVHIKATLFIVVLWLVSIFSCQVNAQEFNELSLDQLEIQLNAILKTRIPEEKTFISETIKLVRDEKLPRKLVNTSFKYVTKKRPLTKYPFVYFVRVLQFQATRDNVEAPKFDFKIYSQRRIGRS